MTPRRPQPDEPASQLRRIPIREGGEPLLDPLELAPELYWVPKHPVFAYPRVRLARAGLIRKLAQAAASLPAGVRLAVVECWRAPFIQRQMHARTKAALAERHPEWPSWTLSRMANRYSAPLDPRAPPPHSTGGAVDVHVVDAEGLPLDMVSPYGIVDRAAMASTARGLSPTASENRRMLREAMLSAGLTNYPVEWWHWSYGDQAWAYRGGHEAALYGQVIPEELRDREYPFEVYPEPGW